MAFTSSFFDAELDVYEEYDRVYSAEDFAEYFGLFIGNGVFPTPATQMQVIASTTPDMNVNVSSGFCWINGYKGKNDGNYSLAIQAASGTQNRVDAVVVRWVKADRKLELAVKTGTAAGSPVAPTLERTSEVYELMLATVTLAAGTTAITQAMITDKRPDNTVCGFVTGVVQQIDTTNLFAQYDDAFQTWFDNIKVQLSDNVVTNLQNQIDQRVKISDKATDEDISTGNPNKWVSSKQLKSSQLPIGTVIEVGSLNNNDWMPLNDSVILLDAYPEFKSYAKYNLMSVAGTAVFSTLSKTLNNAVYRIQSFGSHIIRTMLEVTNSPAILHCSVDGVDYQDIQINTNSYSKDNLSVNANFTDGVSVYVFGQFSSVTAPTVYTTNFVVYYANSAATPVILQTATITDSSFSNNTGAYFAGCNPATKEVFYYIYSSHSLISYINGATQATRDLYTLFGSSDFYYGLSNETIRYLRVQTSSSPLRFKYYDLWKNALYTRSSGFLASQIVYKSDFSKYLTCVSGTIYLYDISTNVNTPTLLLQISKDQIDSDYPTLSITDATLTSESDIVINATIASNQYIQARNIGQADFRLSNTGIINTEPLNIDGDYLIDSGNTQAWPIGKAVKLIQQDKTKYIKVS